MPRKGTRTPQGAENIPTPAEYNSFISQIELHSIWLSSAQIENRHGHEKPERATVQVKSKASWEPDVSGFKVFHTYNIVITKDTEAAAEVKVIFGLLFNSDQAMTDDIFRVFQDVNLPVNTWPYLRSFLADMLGRMGWIPFTLPTFKYGIKSGDSAPVARSSRTRRRVARSTDDRGTESSQ